MDLTFGRRRVLRCMERELAASDPQLVGLFSMFALLERDEQLPGADRLTPGPVPPSQGRHEWLAAAPGCGWPWWIWWPGWHAP